MRTPTQRWAAYQAYFPQTPGGKLWLAFRLLLALVGAMTLLTVLVGLCGAISTGALQKVWSLKSQIEPIRVTDLQGQDLGVLSHCDTQPQAVSNPVRCRQTTTLHLNEIPQSFLLAYLAKEDVRYFQHPGLDFGRIPGSLLSGAGGSTITMQLLKNNILAGHFDYDTSLRGAQRVAAGLVRKATEYTLAPLLSLRYSKADVLEMSVNSLPWLGIGQRKGLNDASRIMFGKSARDLTLAQSAFLVGLLPRPSTYLVKEEAPLQDSTEQFRYMRQQQLLTLGILHVHGLITDEQYAQATAERIQPSLWQVSYAGAGANLTVAQARHNPDFQNAPDPALSLQALIQRELREQGISPARVGRVQLTIDAQAQQRLTQAVSRLHLSNVAQGAAIVDTQTGGMVALGSSTGGDLSTQPQQQWAVNALRPVASTVKPLLYATAFGSANNPEGQPLNQLSRFPDQPTRYYGQSINNNSRTFLRRAVTIREANARSLNTVAVQVGLRYEDALSDTLRAVGYQSDPANHSSPALGTWRASPLTVAAAYASFASGSRCQPHVIDTVYDTLGRQISLPQTQCKALWSPQVAAQTFDMLRGAVTEPYSHVKFLRGAARLGAKSGTTDNMQDSWCAGLTPNYAMSVWIGDPSGVQPLPVRVYEHQNACRMLGLLSTLPAGPPPTPPLGLRLTAGAVVPDGKVPYLNPPHTTTNQENP